MVTPTRTCDKCDTVFYTSVSVFLEDYDKECPMVKLEQFSKCGFGVNA